MHVLKNKLPPYNELTWALYNFLEFFLLYFFKEGAWNSVLILQNSSLKVSQVCGKTLPLTLYWFGACMRAQSLSSV